MPRPFHVLDVPRIHVRIDNGHLLDQRHLGKRRHHQLARLTRSGLVNGDHRRGPASGRLGHGDANEVRGEASQVVLEHPGDRDRPEKGVFPEQSRQHYLEQSVRTVRDTEKLDAKARTVVVVVTVVFGHKTLCDPLPTVNQTLEHELGFCGHEKLGRFTARDPERLA